jgi:hypothetical protein
LEVLHNLGDGCMLKSSKPMERSPTGGGVVAKSTGPGLGGAGKALF